MKRIVSLFSGIGGFDLGFIQNGFEIIWANDFDKFATQTYRANIGDHIVLGDIREAKSSIPKHDILIGGFPCQPFSMLGKLKGFEDKGRGDLFFEICDIAKKYDTKILVLENVANVVKHDKGSTFKKMIKELEELNYQIFWDILNTADYGIPQIRNRLFIVAFNKKYFKNINFEFPKKEPLKLITQDLLDKEVDISYFLSHKLAKTILSPGTKGYIVKPTIDQKICKTFTATMHKMHRASQDNYITDNENFKKFNDGNKTNIRKLTPNECRKLQGFPDGFRQVVSNCQAYKQFGNAVSVNVSAKLAKQIKLAIEKSKKGI